MLLARIVVTPRPELNDPQGRAVHRALETLGFDEAEDVRVGKYLEVSLDLESRVRAEARVHEMCERLLANQVIEDYRYEITEGGRAPSGAAPPGPPLQAAEAAEAAHATDDDFFQPPEEE
ncbi:MAG: phosphoribosylformylglycinamidine synthase subunit PurS [Candidatus Dormibacteraeota bacterium]|nr:phosphoribosylformylglycinamidine synthase subunit PurS [Candidatus Dormibacteraeota bacterium]